MYGIGKSSTRGIAILAFCVMTKFGASMIKYFLPMVLLIGPYIICFEWIDGKRMRHQQIYNVYKIKSV